MLNDEASGASATIIGLIRRGAADPVLAALRPQIIDPPDDAHPAIWRQAWISWQEVRGFGSDLITPPDHYRPNPYWAPNQIRLWAYNRCALLLVEPRDTGNDELKTLLHYLS